MKPRKLHVALLLVAISLLTVTTVAQSKVTTPKEQLGFNFGDDYQLANYAQLVEYWKKLDQQSDRMSLVECQADRSSGEARRAVGADETG